MHVWNDSDKNESTQNTVHNIVMFFFMPEKKSVCNLKALFILRCHLSFFFAWNMEYLGLKVEFVEKCEQEIECVWCWHIRNLFQCHIDFGLAQRAHIFRVEIFFFFQQQFSFRVAWGIMTKKSENRKEERKNQNEKQH